MDLARIVYVSLVGSKVRIADTNEIARQSAKNNARIDVTGYLLYTPKFFVQAIEGAPEKLEPLFERIARDPRHTDVRRLHDGPIAKRLFGDWSMAIGHYGILPRLGERLLGVQEWDAKIAMELLQEAAVHGVTPGAKRGLCTLSLLSE